MATKKEKLYCVVNSDKPLNFRKGPSLDAPVYTLLNDGDKLELVEPSQTNTTGFIKVKYRGEIGYVMKKYVILPTPKETTEGEETNDGE